ncbi:hypothetical protein CDAR_180051 [Caerostris darwini]|uniref:Uncharacterized protein n=1 Tax=Caerostris darwini TaxID=1538125 RepID=A0AAV4TVD4_9ARAC|nr:hypothetical protein CDAR_180051 [Caerostris darwini]
MTISFNTLRTTLKLAFLQGSYINSEPFRLIWGGEISNLFPLPLPDLPPVQTKSLLSQYFSLISQLHFLFETNEMPKSHRHSIMSLNKCDRKLL